jgi:hypothetical protein
MNFEGIEIAEDAKQKLMEQYNSALNEANKKATENANKILDSVANNFSENYGVQRLASETKIVDFLKRAVMEIGKKANNSDVVKEKETLINELKQKLDSKIDDKSLIEEFETKIKVLNESLINEQTKYKELEESYSKKEQERIVLSSINSSLPQFGDVNKYELEARKKEAIQLFREKHNVKLTEDGKVIYENKETYQNTDAKAFFSEQLKDLVATEKQERGAKPPLKTSGGVLTLTDDMTAKEKDELIKSHLAAQGFKSKVDRGYSEAYAKLLRGE